MMKSYTILKAHYEDIEYLVKMEDPFFYTQNEREWVEVDVDEDNFLRISEELGWI
jgi:hypothetical protein